MQFTIRRSAAIPLVVCTVVLVAHAFYYYPYICDDALISLRYVERFLDGRGLTWTDGPRVEGFSNPLWVLLTAAIGACGLDLVLTVRILGMVASVGVLAAIVFAAQHATATPLWSALAGGLVWAASGPAAAWALAGLETPLAACLLAWSLALTLGLAGHTPVTIKSTLPLGLCLGGLALTRPDGILFTAAVAAWFAFRGHGSRDAVVGALRIASVPVLLMACYLVFRLSYYGEWLPNTAHVKINPSLLTLSKGLDYVGRGLSSLRPLPELGLIALVALWRDRRRRAHGMWLAAVAVAWMGYIATIGGDLFAAWRMMTPVVVVLALVAVLTTALVLEGQSRALRRWALAVVAIALPWFVVTQFRDPLNVRAKNEMWEWSAKSIAEVLQRGFGSRQPLLAVTAAGAMPYWSKLPSLDMLGLNDHHIARVPVAAPGAAWVGHEKGDVEYVLGRAPDLMHFGSAAGGDPVLTYAETMPQSPVFRANYDRCNYGARVSANGRFISRIWTNRNSAKIGIQRQADDVIVPPYLLNITGGAVAMLDGQDRFFVVSSASQPVGIGVLELAAGRWQVVEPSSGVKILLRQSTSEVSIPLLSTTPVTFDAPQSGPYDVLIVAASEPLPIYALRLRRTQ